MTHVLETTPAGAPTDTDLPTAVQRVLAASAEPLTPSKVRSALPPPLRQVSVDELTELLRRQVAAHVLQQYPKYRSQHDRFWDRPMSVHVAALLHAALAEGPLPLSELRRKLPAYAQAQAEAALQDQVTQGNLYRHPRLPGGRGRDLFGVRPPDAKEYLKQELPPIFRRLQGLGFTTERIRAAALELLHDEEWAPALDEPAPAPPSESATNAPSYEWTEPPAASTQPPDQPREEHPS
jgi:hypothetical protein